MLIRNAAGAVAIGLALAYAGAPAQALTMQECSVKYKDAQKAGTLNGMKWNDFRKAQCGADATAQPAAATTAAPAAPAAAPASTPVKPAAAAPTAPAAAPAAPAAAAKPAAAAPAAKPAATGPAVFPNAIAAKYASESAGKGREHTCLDQYNANKATGGNGGLTWIMKGGGYYSECNKHLKGM
jgi:hypothetical protein